MTPGDLSIHLFWQIAFILLACRVVGWCAQRVGQPQVVGEMIAGILLGPSVVGQLAPGWEAWLFPKAGMPLLFAISQIGLALYMFIIGMEFRLELFRERLGKAVGVSLAGMIVPFVLGGMMGIGLFGRADMFGSKTTMAEAALYFGACLCVTAFPVLARIIQERGLSGTPLGTLALAAGAIDDVIAWIALAVLLAFFDHDWAIAVWALAGAIGFCLAVVAARRWVPILSHSKAQGGEISGGALALILVVVMAGSAFTSWIGIHAVFGAFVLGMAVPRGLVDEDVRRKLEPFVVAFLVPLFFTYSGLNTRFDAMTTTDLWTLALLITFVACMGKGVACWATARWQGEDQATALSVGVLMNARGLMELIILNIGLERGIIQPPLFSLLVLMAVVTTVMTSPIFELVQKRFRPARVNLP